MYNLILILHLRHTHTHGRSLLPTYPYNVIQGFVRVKICLVVMILCITKRNCVPVCLKVTKSFQCPLVWHTNRVWFGARTAEDACKILCSIRTQCSIGPKTPWRGSGGYSGCQSLKAASRSGWPAILKMVDCVCRCWWRQINFSASQNTFIIYSIDSEGCKLRAMLLWKQHLSGCRLALLFTKFVHII